MLKESTKGYETMPTDGSENSHKGSHDRGLLLIGLFKLAKAIFFLHGDRRDPFAA